MADTQDTQITKKDKEAETETETEVLAFIQEAYQSSHNWEVVFEKVHQKYNNSNAGCVMNFCAGRGYIQVIQWLRTPILPELPSRTPELPSGTPELPSGTPELSSRTPELSSRTPEFPEDPCPWGEYTCAFAANNGHLHVLRWIRNPVFPDGSPLPGGPCPWGEFSCGYAALNGHVEVLEYLYEAEAPYWISHKVHDNCKEFLDTYGESWASRRFDVPLPWQCMKPAKG